MASSVQIITMISLLTIVWMIILSSLIYYFERDKRQYEALEYWLANGIYFGASYLTSGRGELLISLTTLLWVLRLVTVGRILAGVSGKKLGERWHWILILFSYLLSVGLYFLGFGFKYYTLPQALSSFVVALHYLIKSSDCLRQRGRASVIHYLLFLTIFLTFAHIVDYPFLRMNPQAAVFGYGFLLFSNILMAILLPSVTIFELKRERQLELEGQLLNQSKFSALGEMAAGIAHEINNPLGVISTRAYRLKNHIIKDKAQKDFIVRNLEQIEATSERMSKIINSLRNFSKDNRNEPLKVVSLKSIIEETLAYSEDRFRLGSIELKVNSIPECEIECRPVQISQVLINLLNNSYDAVRNSSHPWVEISFRVNSDRIFIMVQDSGEGIPEAIRRKIMEPFFTTKEMEGTGLGLSISKGIIEDHYGKLTYDDSSEHTTFVIELPYTQPSH